MQKLATQVHSAPAHASLASRRQWLKGFGALVGLGLLAAPTASLAQLAEASGPGPARPMAGNEEHLGTVKLFAGSQVPAGWVRCDGRLLLVKQYPALFAALGTTYGGDGTRTFALPKLGNAAADCLATARGAHAQVALLSAVKVASAAATPHAVAELRLAHHCRRARPAARWA